MKRKNVLGLLALSLIIVGLVGTVSINAVAVQYDVGAKNFAGTGHRGQQSEERPVPKWLEGLTEEQRQELMLKLRELRERAKEEGWSKEELREAIKNRFAEYGIDTENLPMPRRRRRP